MNSNLETSSETEIIVTLEEEKIDLRELEKDESNKNKYFSIRSARYGNQSLLPHPAHPDAKGEDVGNRLKMLNEGNAEKWPLLTGEISLEEVRYKEHFNRIYEQLGRNRGEKTDK